MAGRAGLSLTMMAVVVGAAAANADRPVKSPRPADQVQIQGQGQDEGRLNPLLIEQRETPALRVDLQPVELGGVPARPLGGERGDCQETVTHTDASFEGGSYVLQAGFAEGEVAIASYTVPPDAFPIRLDSAEMIFGTQNATVNTTTEWSFLVWDGPPDTGILIFEFSSDDVILPHIELPPGTNGINVQVSVDPGDPDQIFIFNDSGTNTFSIGYRIDAHNNQTGNPCLTPPPSSSNAFPATDTSGLAEPGGNWVTQVDGAFCFCPGAGDTFPFSLLGLCQPSGDWVMRANITSTNCTEPIGACCVAPGTCLEATTESDCDSFAGVFLGDQTTCSGVVCDPFGGCCLPDGTCEDPVTEANCVAAGGVYLGDQVSCPGDGTCDPEGACCFGPDSCANLTQSDCATAEGEWGGFGTSCASFECDPTGACCLIDGTCEDGLIEDDCVAVGGVFQGRGTTCADVGPCPDPIGACCLANGSCLSNQTEANCLSIPDASWAGPNTSCDDGDGNGTADICESTPCPGDLTGDSLVNTDDLFQLLGAWGDCIGCPSDFNGDDVVNTDDLFQLLGGWGDC